MTLRLTTEDIVAESTSPLLTVANWWERCRLGDIAAVTNGAAFKSAKFNTIEDGLPLIRIRDVGQPKASTHYSGDYKDRHLVESGDLLIGMDGDFRIARWTGGRALLNQRVCRLQIRDSDLYCDRFLEYMLQPYLDEIHKVTSSVTVKHLSSRTVTDLPIPLPPRAEQERIVTALEEHFFRLDAAESALHSAQQRLNALMQSVLRTTCEGPWTTRPLAQVIKSLKNGVFVSRPSATPPGYPIYRISAVRPLTLRIDDIRYADPVPDGAGAYAVEAGDILFTRYSGNPNYVGAAAVVPQAGAGILHPDKLIRVIVDRDTALPEWIAAYVAAGQGRREVEKRLKTTAGQVGISGSQLRTVPIAVPPIDYQLHAVNKIWSVLAEQHRIRQALSSVRARVEALRRSVLALTFSGQLVSQDPTDEPATVLLERIAASRRDTPTRQEVSA